MNIGTRLGLTSTHLLSSPKKQVEKSAVAFAGIPRKSDASAKGWQKTVLPMVLTLLGMSTSAWADPPAANTTPPSQESPSAQAPAETTQKPLTEDDLADKLKTEGLTGPVHGVVPPQQKYVFNYIDPKDFFNQFHFPLLLPRPSDNPEATQKRDQIAETLKNLHRHDKIKVKGVFETKGGAKHIRLSEVEVVKQYQGFPQAVAQDPELQFPKDLLEKTELVGVVHALLKEGKMLVLEYGSSVTPIVVHNVEGTKDLWRGDKVKIRYKVQRNPHQPPHLVLATDLPEGQKSVEVVKPLADFRGKEDFQVKGPLVLFEESAVLTRKTWAIEMQDDDGTKRYFFLMNPDNSEDWDKLDQQFQDWWDADKANIVQSRNKQINRKLILDVTGDVPGLPSVEDAKTPEEREKIEYFRKLSVNQGFLNLHTATTKVKQAEK